MAEQDPAHRGVRVLRLCSVFEPESLPGAPTAIGAARFDPIGGMQNHTAALSRHLDAAGVSQRVVTSRLAGRTGARPLGRRGEVVRVGLPVAWLRQVWAVAAVPAVLTAGRGGRVDVVHAHQGEDVATLLLAAVAAAVHRAPLVVTVHCSVRHTLTGTGWRTLALGAVGGAVERWALRRADAVIALAERTARLLVADGVPDRVVQVVPSGFDPALFDAPHQDPFPELGRPRIGFVGRLGRQKRPDLLVRAFAAMSEKAELVIVGDGPMREQVETLARESPAAARTTMTGFIEHDDVPAVLASLDVLVLPSAYEELGSVLVEALASGLPVVATAVGGIPEVVVDGETGLLVPPGDVGALTAALDRVAADPELRRRLGAAALVRSREFAWPALAGRVLAIYQRVLG